MATVSAQPKTLEQQVSELMERVGMLEKILEKLMEPTEVSPAAEAPRELIVPKDSFKDGSKLYRHKYPLIWHNGKEIITEDATDEENALIIKNYPNSDFF